MFFEDAIFPEQLGYLAQGGAEWKTSITEQDNGVETRNQDWTQSRGTWSISGGLMTKDTIGKLGFYNIKNFHNAMRGRLYGFRFKDFNDFSATTATGLLDKGYGTGMPTQQLGKRYKTGSAFSIKDIKKPVLNTAQVYKNGILMNGGYTVDYTTGVVTFTPLQQFTTTLNSINYNGTVPTRYEATVGANNTLQIGQKVYVESENELINGRTFVVTYAEPTTFRVETGEDLYAELTTAGQSANVNATFKVFQQQTDIMTASFEFDYPVRFDNDDLHAGMDEAGFISIDSITLVELRT